MTIHLIPVIGEKVNQNWGTSSFGRFEKLFIRCNKNGQYKKMHGKTPVYTAYEVLYRVTVQKDDFVIHWDKLAKNL